MYMGDDFYFPKPCSTFVVEQGFVTVLHVHVPVKQVLTRVMKPAKSTPVRFLRATTSVIDTTAMISAYSTT